ncbi:hypothetical protein ACP275_03G111200 [Erythranthe tilingii]
MNPPTDDLDFKPEKLGEEKEGGAQFHCDLYDTDLVYKTAQELLPGLASACVDNTTGGLFRNPASVAVDIRREMVDYLIQRSENYVAESVVVLEGGANAEMSDDPYDIISDFIDDFASSKRNFFSKVSGWLLSERREDRIDDFVQEMEINGFWLLNRRESVAQTLLKNVDFKNIHHCSMNFKSAEDVEEHKLSCGFRTMICTNEGCNARFTAAQSDQHDSVCPFKILQCEQKCEDFIMRREMDRHCITVCPMKLVKCPFYSVGCHSSVPQCKTEQHRSEDLSSHLLYVLHVSHKEASTDDLKIRVEELIQISSPGQLALARDARSLTFAIRPLEAKLGPLKINTTAKSIDEVKELTTDKDEESAKEVKELTTDKDEESAKEVKSEESPASKREESVNNSPSNSESPPNNEKFAQSVEKLEKEEGVNKAEIETGKEKVAEPVIKHEQLTEEEKEHTHSAANRDNHDVSDDDSDADSVEKSEKEEGLNKAEIEIGKEKVAEPIVKHEHVTKTEEEQTYSVANRDNHADSDAESDAKKSSN